MGNNIIKNTLAIDLKQRINELFNLKLSKNYQLVFTVGNTRVFDESKYYLTPIRIVDNLIISGIILFSEDEGKEVFRLIDGKVDYIFVDCEKKSKNNASGLFNLERLATEIVNKSKLNYYKGNDITTDSIDNFLFTYFKENKMLVGGKNVLIIGIGNIGFKIALKLVERGANIFIKSRDLKKAKNVAKTINSIKPKETISMVCLYDSDQVIQFNAIILTHIKPIVNNDTIFKRLSGQEVLIDVGKGCLTIDQIIQLQLKNVPSFRLDVGDAFVSSIISTINNSQKFKLPRRKLLNSGLSIIEPGIIGLKDEIVVNSIDCVTFIYGVCNGLGGFERSINKDSLLKLINNEDNINYGM